MKNYLLEAIVRITESPLTDIIVQYKVLVIIKMTKE